MKINWLADCDNVSTCTTRSNFIVVDDDHSLGSFGFSTSIVSFNTTTEVHDFGKDQCSDFSFKEMPVATDEAIAKEKTRDHLPTDDESSAENPHCSSAHATVFEHTINQVFTTNELKGVEG